MVLHLTKSITKRLCKKKHICKSNWVIIYNKAITSVEQLKEIESKYDALFLGVGLGPTASLGIHGEEGANVIGAVEFIEELRMKHHNMKVPAKVVVIGGGNTAMDAASESARMGAEEVTLAYRRDKKGMGAYKFEYDLALSAGVKGLFNASPLEITAKGVRFIKTQEVNGKLENIAGSEFTIECDLVIKATGQAKMGALLKQINGLQLDKSNRIVVNSESFQTGNPKYFAGGDAVNGGAEVVNGAYEGKMAAIGIHNWLTK
jgi:dihydropyrimidine dehydrogenase (NAD+) subunit PreT